MMKEIGLHIRVMVVAAIVTAAAIGAGIGLAMALVKARQLPNSHGQPGMVATIAWIQAADDAGSRPDPHQARIVMRY